MTVAVAILAHNNLHRVAKVAQFLNLAGIHVAIHVDATVSPQRFQSLKTTLSGCENVLWAKRTDCEWGEFSIVEATLNMSATVLETWPDVSHVLLISGGTLPIRPLSDLIVFLNQHPNTDFIESTVVNENHWVNGGLGIERFTLFFPFSWKKQRWLFDRWVDLQRVLKINRRAPENLSLHIGSQWWCLTRRTLQSILSDPDKSANDAYFQKCWIPDESYFQTLARKHSSNIESRSLVFSRFDHQGKPTVFYDDHAPILDELDEFFVRKVWHGADKLYDALSTNVQTPDHAVSRSEPANELISRISAQCKTGRTGLYMQGRAPCRWNESQMTTAVPYSVFSGISAVFKDIDNWLGTHANLRTQGRIFAKENVEFSNSSPVGPGGLSISAKIRDLAPDAFLCNLIWNTQNDKLGFHFETGDTPEITSFILQDPNAEIYHIRYSWVIELMTRKISNVDFLLSEATRLAQIERAFIAAIASPQTVATVHVWTVGEALSAPAQVLAKIEAASSGGNSKPVMLLPEIADTSELMTFGQTLKNIGVDLDVFALEVTTSDTISSGLRVVT